MALQLARTAVAAAPQLPDVSDTLGWVYYKRKMPALAIPQFLRSIELAPNVATYHHHLGLVYLQAGDAERARTALEKALATGPDAATTAAIKKALSETAAVASSH